ncbi:hypothetical protein ANO14919_114680 [Xylariales sp. No.14919]|nr:hypothetical protein ANO14919_114680 [Xylariales sp. No.14919]
MGWVDTRVIPILRERGLLYLRFSKRDLRPRPGQCPVSEKLGYLEQKFEYLRTEAPDPKVVLLEL